MPHTVALNWIDWVTLGLVLVSILRGARLGAPAQLLDLAALIATYLAAAVYFPFGVEYLSRIPSLTPSWQGFISFVLVWMGLYLPLSMLVKLALGGISFPARGVLGALLGMTRGFVLAGALLVLTLAAPFRTVIAADAHHSQVAPYLLSGNTRFQRLLRTTLPIGKRVPRLGPGGTVF
jgi:membrane protein required for colicin V production